MTVMVYFEKAHLKDRRFRGCYQDDAKVRQDA